MRELLPVLAFPTGSQIKLVVLLQGTGANISGNSLRY